MYTDMCVCVYIYMDASKANLQLSRECILKWYETYVQIAYEFAFCFRYRGEARPSYRSWRTFSRGVALPPTTAAYSLARLSYNEPVSRIRRALVLSALLETFSLSLSFSLQQARRQTDTLRVLYSSDDDSRTRWLSPSLRGRTYCRLIVRLIRRKSIR